jgi:hypothetical protein
MADSIYLWSVILEWKKGMSGFDRGPSAMAQGKTLGWFEGATAEHRDIISNGVNRFCPCSKEGKG